MMNISISVEVSIIHNYLVADLHDKNPSFLFTFNITKYIRWENLV